MNEHHHTPKKKSITLYIMLIVGPFIALVLSAVMQVLVRLLGLDSDVVVTILNIFSFVIGIVSVLAILLLPLWIILLIKATQDNKSIGAQQPQQPSQGPPNRP